jgi:c-di-GMP-binding flagellar brake protein YcgR
METTKSKWDTIFIGSKPKRYLVLEQPKVNGLPIKFDDNSKWSINFINNGQIFNFLSEVIGTCSRPVPLVFLSYPENVETANLRHNKRYPVRIPITVEEIPETKDAPAIPATKGLILDISLGGCLAATTGDLPVETNLSVNLYFDKEVSINGLKMEKKSGRRVMGTFYSGLSYLPTNNLEIMNKVTEIISDIENIPLRI